MSNDEVIPTDDFTPPEFEVKTVKQNPPTVINPSGIKGNPLDDLLGPVNGKPVIPNNPPTANYVPPVVVGKLRRPRDYPQVLDTFGQPARGICSEVKLFIGDHAKLPIDCHELMRDVYVQLIKDFRSLECFDMIQSVQGYMDCAMRNRRPGMNKSPQAWGIGFMLNEAYNKPGRTAKFPSGHPEHRTTKIPPLPGYTLYNDHPLVVAAEKLGFMWFGRERYLTGLPNVCLDPALFAFVEEW